MTVKQPFVWSTSGYNHPDVDVADSEIPVAAALCRATLGLTFKDLSFRNYWNNWRQRRIARSAYHYLINAYSAADQAKHFLAFVNECGGFQPGDVICLDVEDQSAPGVSIKAIIDWFWQVQIMMPHLEPAEDFLIYSRADIMNALNLTKLTDAQRFYVLGIPGWTAGYPDNPDLWTTEQLLSAYRFDPAKFGPTVGSQYQGSAYVAGLSRPEYESIECNVFKPDYLQRWQERTLAGSPPLPPPPTGGTVYAYKAIVTSSIGLKVRSEPNTTSPQVGSAVKGAICYGNETIGAAGQPDYWLSVKEINGSTDITGWIAIRYQGIQYADLVVQAPPDPTPAPLPNEMHLTIESVVDGVVVATYKGVAVKE